MLPGHVFVIMNTAKRRELKDSKYNVRREECERALAQLQEKQAIRTLSEIKPQELDTLMPSVSDPVLQKRVRHVVTENVRVQEMMQAMETGDTEKMGRILNEGHASLRDDYEVTGPELDAITKRAREHPNCVGARMTGAGFGGCAIALVEKEAVDSFTSFVGEQYFKDTGLVAGFLYRNWPAEPKKERNGHEHTDHRRGRLYRFAYGALSAGSRRESHRSRQSAVGPPGSHTNRRVLSGGSAR